MEEEDINLNVSDSENVPLESHSKLLNAISLIYSKKRIDKPVRREPTSQISEFNLSHRPTTNKSKLIDVRDLVNTLNEKATHNEIKKKVTKLHKKSRTLRKPMEKLHADKIRRQLGYGNIRKQLSRWEAIVERNRGAEQLHFPLENNEKLSIEKDSHDFLKTFKEPTELEKKVAEILKTSEVAQKDEEEEKQLFPLSLDEIIERRKIVGRMRARESYRIVKAIRQNKIKSKKYHRILKRERIKKELKDFEILQKTNPEAALEKLERIERARAEERITLRHRNTGKWAKSRAIRAKYDTEARAQLAEQLAKSRELTQKIKSGLNSSSEDEVNDAGEDEEILKTDSSNPWKSSIDNESEIQSFVEGFKKYQQENTVKKPDDSISGNFGSDNNLKSSKSDQNVELNMVSEEVVNEEKNTASNSNSSLISHVNVELTNNFSVDSHNQISDEDENLKETQIENEDLCETLPTKSPLKNINKSINNEVSIKEKSLKKIVKKNSTLKRNLNKKTTLKKMKKLKTISGVWSILESDEDKIITNKKNLTIDKLLDNAEDMLKERLNNRIEKLKSNVNKIDKSLKNKDKKSKYKVDLSFKSKHKTADSDTALIEVAGEGISGGEHEVRSLINILENENKVDEIEQNIDPNKFLPAKPSKLNSAGFNFARITEETEDKQEDEQLNLEEAFADDNVVDEFRREKEDEVDSSKPKDVDLSLPGWGHWAGHHIKPFNKNKLKRKTRRLIFKVPEIKRKDDKKDYVIINDDLNPSLKKHMVHDLPFPFKSVKDYETSIRAPIGNTWVPQSAFMKLIEPAVVTKLGSIIEPMSEAELLKNKRKFVKNKRKKV